MTTGRRRVWAELRFAHPAVDPMDPTDDFAAAVLTAAGGDRAVWDEGTESEALTAYHEALRAVMPDHTAASLVLREDPTLAVEASVCLDMGISHEEFLTWPDRSQDFAIAAALARRDTCAAGHPREGMADVEAVQIRRVYCAVCARVHDLEERMRELGPDYTVGWHTEVTRR